MKHGLMIYDENQRTFNVGDYIQSLAAKQFLPKVDHFINREKLAEYQGDDIQLIMNGWFTHNTTNWVPAKKIHPLLVSFHINNTAAPNMLSMKGINFLKQNQPVGCRDHFTVEQLKAKGIDAYFSGCMTLTLDSYKVDDSERGDDIYIVDPLYGFPNKQRIFYDVRSVLRSVRNGEIFNMHVKDQFMQQIFTEEFLAKAHYVEQELPARTYTEEQKFAMAEDLLHKYARAKLVITSRIHCALPCLALGTPVIYINGFDSFVDSCRLDGLANLFNRIDIERKTKKVTNNFGLNGKIGLDFSIQNTNAHVPYAEAMKKRCREFIHEAAVSH